MDFNTFQSTSRKTAIYPPEYGVMYTALGLCSEAGEVVDKLKKVIRDQDGDMRDSDTEAIAKELGDVLWYVSNLAYELGLSLEYIAETNCSKLADRMERDSLSGSGDDR